MKSSYKSRVYTDRPAYADFDPPAKFQAIQSIVARRLREHPNAICSYSGGADSDIMIDLIERTREIFGLPPIKYVFFNTGLEMQATKDHVKSQPKFREGETGTPVRCEDGSWCFQIDQYKDVYEFELSPPYHPGDTLYVRETWAIQENLWNGMDTIIYLADYNDQQTVKWRPSIHMPKEAARIFLRVTDVRVERLQDITEDQAEQEGARRVYPFDDYRYGFRILWDRTIFSTTKPDDRVLYNWDANPWVWVIEFERISREEAGGK